jgi:hypothetical protein
VPTLPSTVPKTLIDHVKAIYEDQRVEYYDELRDFERKTFEPYMVNRFLSMNPDQLLLVNEAQLYYDSIGPRESYLFYSQLIPKGKQFHKYVKAKVTGKYERWLLDAVAAYFEVSRAEATDYVRILYLTDAGRDELRMICKTANIPDKKLQKANL